MSMRHGTAVRIAFGLIAAAAIVFLGGGGQAPPRHPPAPTDREAPIAACPTNLSGAAEGPVQLEAPRGMASIPINDHRAEPRAAFAVEATVLGVEPYRRGPESAVSPLDLALGWGPMADPAVYAALGITQSGRWYHYRWGDAGPPLPVESIIRHSGNLHIVPATPAIAARLAGLRTGQRVRVSGWLVDIVTPEGYRWSTSLSRDDTGDGACEIVYVCEVATLP